MHCSELLYNRYAADKLNVSGGYGAFWHDRYKPVIESIVNIVVSIYLVRRYEVIGIFLARFSVQLL